MAQVTEEKQREESYKSQGKVVHDVVEADNGKEQSNELAMTEVGVKSYFENYKLVF